MCENQDELLGGATSKRHLWDLSLLPPNVFVPIAWNGFVWKPSFKGRHAHAGVSKSDRHASIHHFFFFFLDGAPPPHNASDPSSGDSGRLARVTRDVPERVESLCLFQVILCCALVDNGGSASRAPFPDGGDARHASVAAFLLCSGRVSTPQTCTTR